MIWLTCHRIEQGLQISLNSNRCIQQVWLDRATENQDWTRSCTSSVKTTNPLTYTINDQIGEPVQGAFLRTRAAAECTGNLSYCACTQEEEKSSIRQVERLE